MASRIIGTRRVGVDYLDNILLHTIYVIFVLYKRKNVVVVSGRRFYVGKRHKIVYDDNDDIRVIQVTPQFRRYLHIFSNAFWTKKVQEVVGD